MNRKDINCRSCGVLVRDAHPIRKFCEPCAIRRSMYGTRDGGNKGAYYVMSAAIRHGFLAPANTHKCVDCGSQAECYDHRDYNKPLDVEPVCSACNMKRGPGIPRRA